MIKAAFFDVDGTLLSHTSGTVPESAKRALDVLCSHGVVVGLATGRSTEEMRELPFDDLRFDANIMLNGQMILDGDGRYVSGNPLTGKALEGVLALFEAREVPMVLIERDRSYMNFVTDYVRSTQADIHSSVMPLGEYRGDTVFQAIAFVDEGGMERLRRQLPTCDITRWHTQAVDINAPSPGGKADGIARWCEASGVDIADVAAFGDGENDVTMLRAVGYGVAMGNAVPDAKAAARFVTSDIDDDGVWNALALLGL